MTMLIVINTLENPESEIFRESTFLSCARPCSTLSQTASYEHLDSATAFRRQLIEFYVEREEQMNNAHFYLQRFTELASDIQFLIPLYHEIGVKLSNDWPTYLYILEHAPKNSTRDQYSLNGTYHCDELGHFTDNSGFYPVRDGDEEYESFGSHFVSSLVNFIKN
ncbi:hypothetical protein PRIPAC_77188, partial [Pristionchus pacificus]|uniref:Esterase n=1 Tax=Pristionchus pacificus TaxID=54126 RepID=A0A2A6CPW3_PRIPA